MPFCGDASETSIPVCEEKVEMSRRRQEREKRRTRSRERMKACGSHDGIHLPPCALLRAVGQCDVWGTGEKQNFPARPTARPSSSSLLPLPRRNSCDDTQVTSNGQVRISNVLQLTVDYELRVTQKKKKRAHNNTTHGRCVLTTQTGPAREPRLENPTLGSDRAKPGASCHASGAARARERETRTPTAHNAGRVVARLFEIASGSCSTERQATVFCHRRHPPTTHTEHERV